MGHLLRERCRLITEPTQSTVVVEEFIAEGGQGEVFLGSYNNQKVAIKWYFPQTASQTQYSILRNLVNMKPPNDKFLWPIELVKSDIVTGFGYIMPLRPPHFHGIVKIINRELCPDFNTLCTISFQIVKSFYELHCNGLSYCDINFGNIFFDPDSGNIVVCDLDNVTFDGTSEVGVSGTTRFMAPEIVRGESGPNIYTDLYSMAILLYYLFFLEHPLHGKTSYNFHCHDQKALDFIYGIHPVYTFSKHDDSNRPVPNVHNNPILFSKIYPSFFKDLFHEVFTTGLLDFRNGRIAESIWMKRIIELQDLIICCENCGAYTFIDPEKIEEQKECWNCSHRNSVQPFIEINKKVIALRENKLLKGYYLSGDCFNEKAFAKVVMHPQKRILGLTNLSSSKWTCSIQERMIEIHPKQTIGISDGISVNFGLGKGYIHA